jgi:hypothetical protein
MAILDDEAFLNEAPPSATETVAGDTPPIVDETPDVVVEPPASVVEEVIETPTQKPETDTPASGESIELPNQENGEADNALSLPKAEEPETETVVKTVVKPEATIEAVPEIVNFEAKYKEAMAPLKANGKTIEIQSMDELRQLASMGANFTRKMQDIAPHRKILAMLENNGLLDETKLSFFIDLDKKNPEALKKLIKDSGVDPLDIDVSSEPAYKAGNHVVSDNEIAFRAVLEDLQSTPTGQETISLINASWDQASKEELWKAPEVMATIQQQRENGIYDTISAEINRQAMLGKISAGTPFIQAYLTVGNELNTRGAFTNLNVPSNKGVQNAPTQTTAPVIAPVATRVVAPKSQVANGAAANAAAFTRQTQKRVVPVVNLQSMSDDDFLKNWQNRL